MGAGPTGLSNGQKQTPGGDSAEAGIFSSQTLSNSKTGAWQLADLVCAE